jgi:DNA-binding MarR family transcriptional regulator
MTGEPRPTTDQPHPANSNFAVLAAIADLGLDATPAAIADKVGIAYSTVNPKLRSWETAGLAERFRHANGQTLWRLTDAGRASTATPPQYAEAEPPVEPTTTGPASGSEATESAATCAGADDDPATSASVPPTGSDTTISASAAADTRIDVDPGHDDEPSPVSTDTTPGDDDTPPIGTGTASKPAVDEADDAPSAQVDGDTVAAAPAKRKRPKGALRASALAILQANPDSEYTIDQLKKLIDRVDAGTGYPRASPGAVSNALDNLERDGKAVKVVDRKAATFTLAPTTD